MEGKDGNAQPFSRVVPVFVMHLCIFAVFSSFARATSYGDLSGATIDFLNINEANNSLSNSDIDLFGAPTVSGDQILFFPTQFISSSVDGASDTTTGTLQMFLQAKPGTSIERVRIEEFGDYLFTGSGTNATQADVSLYLTVTPYGAGGTLTDFNSYDFELPIHSSGGFDLIADVIFDIPVTAAMISLNNNLSTTSEDGTTSLIQKKVVNGPAVALSVNPVPVPGAAWLILTGIVGLVPVIRGIGKGKHY